MSDEDSNSGKSHVDDEYDDSVPPISERRVPGSARDRVKVADDFDETASDFEEYTR